MTLERSLPDDRAELAFSLFGPVRVRCHGTEITLGTRRQPKGFLALLVAADGRPVPTGELAAGLFEPRTYPVASEAVAAVRTCAYRIRTALKPVGMHQAIAYERTTDTYRLDAPGCTNDLATFERLTRNARSCTHQATARELFAEALAIASQDPLIGATGPAVERLAEALRAEVRAVRITKLTLDSELGDRPMLANELSALLAEQPADDQLRHLFMLEHHRSGRTDLALRVAGAFSEAQAPRSARLAHRIRSGDSTLVPVNRTISVPEQLPADVAHFVGRATAVRQGCATLQHTSPATPAVFCIAGFGGMGKTTLGVRIAHTCHESFPGGRIFLDLRGTDDDPVPTDVALSHLLTALGVPEARHPNDTAERAALMRSTIAGRRLLIVLDNAANTAQVAPLLPGAGPSAVLITSRARLGGLTGAQHLHLGILEADEATDLFARLAGADLVATEPTATATVVEACGRLPLAIRVAAGSLSTSAPRPVAALAATLREERTRISSLKTAAGDLNSVFAASYKLLDPGSARLFRVAALPDTPDISVPTLAALLGVPRSQAFHDAETLVDLNLLDCPVGSRYRYHSLLRDYARQKATDTDGVATIRQAGARLLDHVLATARNADAAIKGASAPQHQFIAVSTTDPGVDFGVAGPSAAARAASGWLRAEAPLMAAAVHWACRDPGLSLAQAADLADKMAAVTFGKTAVAEAARIAILVADTATTRDEPGAEALARFAAGTLLWHRNDFADAADQLTRALPLCEPRPETKRLRASILLTLGACARSNDRYEQAATALGEAAAIRHSFGETVAEGSILGDAAYSYAMLGRADQARAAAAQCVELTCAEPGPTREGAGGHYYAARAYRVTGDLDDALRHAETAQEQFRTLGLETSNINAATRALTARIHADAGRGASAVTEAEAVLPLCRDAAPSLEAAALTALGLGRLLVGKPEGSLDLKRAAEIYDSLGMARDAASIRSLYLRQS